MVFQAKHFSTQTHILLCSAEVLWLTKVQNPSFENPAGTGRVKKNPSLGGFHCSLMLVVASVKDYLTSILGGRKSGFRNKTKRFGPW